MTGSNDPEDREITDGAPKHNWNGARVNNEWGSNWQYKSGGWR